MNPDNIEPVPFLITMALLVAAWLFIGIRDRIHARRAIDRWRKLVERWDSWVRIGACAHLWIEGDDAHVCTRPHEHTGPHLDRIHQALHR